MVACTADADTQDRATDGSTGTPASATGASDTSSPATSDGTSDDAEGGPAGEKTDGVDETGSDSEGSGGGPMVEGCPAAAVWCESFESSATLDPARWTVGGPADSVLLDTEVGYDGSHSLHVRMGEAYGIAGGAAATIAQGIPAPDDRLYARWYMRMEDLSLPGYHPNLVTVYGADYDIGHWWDFGTLSFGTFLGELSVNAFGLGLDGAKLWTEPDNEVLPDFGGDTTPGFEHHIQAGAWFCVEWMLFGDHQGPSDESHPGEEHRIWIDGVEIDALYGNDELWGPWGASEHWSPIYDQSIWTFGIGGAYPESATIDVWFDAIVFSHEPIGCAPR